MHVKNSHIQIFVHAKYHFMTHKLVHIEILTSEHFYLDNCLQRVILTQFVTAMKSIYIQVSHRHDR